MTGLSRRDMLRAGSALIVSFAMRPLGRAADAGKFAGKPVDGAEVDSFLAIHPDGSATVFTGKVDLGTGLRIAVRQMAAEELGLPIEKVDLVEGDTLLTPDQGRTGGSSGIDAGRRRGAAGGGDGARAAGGARGAAVEPAGIGAGVGRRPQVRPQAGGNGRRDRASWWAASGWS